MIDKDLPSLGFKDMHPLQVEAIVDFVNLSLNLACMTEDEEIIEELEASADEMIHLLGGNGVSVKIEIT